MKFFYFVWNDLVLYYRKNKRIFLLYCLSGVISTLAVLYFYGNTLPIVYNQNSTELYYREFRLLSGGAPFSEDSLRALLDEEKIEGVTAVCQWENREEMEDGTIALTQLAVAADLQGDPPGKVMYGKASFEGAARYSVIVPYDAGLRVGDKWEFLGKEFQVIGVHGENLYYIPPDVFDELSLEATDAWVYAAKKSDVDDGSAQKLLFEKFGESAQIREPIYGKIDRIESQRMMLLIGGVYALGILSFLLLFSYLMEETERESAVYRVLGASGGLLALLHFTELLLLSTLTAGAGVALHAALYTPVFSRWAVNATSVFSARDYLTVFFGTVFLTLLIALPFILRIVRRTPKNALLAADR